MKTSSRPIRIFILSAFFGCGFLALALDKIGEEYWSQIFLAVSGGTLYLVIWWAILIGLIEGELYINLRVFRGTWVRILSAILLVSYIFISMGIWKLLTER